MKEDGAPHCRDDLIAANDNGLAPDTVEAALTRVAEAIGRHIAREHIRARLVANDNKPILKNPTAPKR